MKLTITCRFVSFLLRVAHDRARTNNAKDAGNVVDGATVLMDQIVALSKQIEAAAAVKAPSGTSAPQRAGVFRATHMQRLDSVAHAGVNF